MKISAINPPEQQINMKGRLIKLGTLSPKEESAIREFLSLVADGITNKEVITKKPYNVYVEKDKSGKKRLQIFGVYEQCCHEFPTVQFNLTTLFYNRKSSKPNTQEFRTNLNRFEERKLDNWGYSNDLDYYILGRMRESNRKPKDGYNLFERLLIAIWNKF